jgi:two-component system, cell cycle sensor histidine kinase and response regulator CckA
VADEHEEEGIILGIDTTILGVIDDAVSIGDAERHLLYWNAAAERLFDTPFAEARGKRFEDIVEFKVIAPGGGASGIATTAAGNAWRGDAVMRTRSGEIRRIETTASPIMRDRELVGRISILRDATEIRRESDTLAAVFAASPLAVIVFDGDRRIQFWSAAATRLFGWEASELIGTSAKLVPPDELEAAAAIWARMDAGDVGPFDVHRLHRDGSAIEVRSWGAPLPNEGSMNAGAAARPRMVIFVDDLRERRTLEAQLAESQKLESIGRLAGGVAHDFNNLLMAIGGYAELLEPEGDPVGEQDAHIRGIRYAVDQAAELTRQLLAFSRKQELRPKVLDMRHIVDSVVPMLGRLLGERIRIAQRHPDDLWPVTADRSQLEAALVNLAVNARDAMPDGGTITIETANVELDETYAQAHAEVVPGPYAMVAVSDTGSGMDEETAGQIFEPFFTTKEIGRGTGLGLATVYGTVRQSGGHIWVYSEPGQGTTFKIYLPRAEAVLPAEGDVATPVRPLVAATATVLLVEDEAIVRDMMVIVLERRGYRVVAVSSGEAALEVLASIDATIDVLLTDVVMPGMDGLELFERLATIRPALPAVFMSGYTAMTLQRRPIPDGAEVLEKPFTAARLDETIRAALGGAADSGAGPR